MNIDRIKNATGGNPAILVCIDCGEWVQYNTKCKNCDVVVNIETHIERREKNLQKRAMAIALTQKYDKTKGLL